MSNEDVWKAWQAAAFESLIQSLCSCSLSVGVVNLERQRDDIYNRSQRIVLFKFIVIFIVYSFGCSNWEICVFTGEKGFPV